MNPELVRDYFESKGYATIKKGGHLYKKEGDKNKRIKFSKNKFEIEVEHSSYGSLVWSQIQSAKYSDVFINNQGQLEKLPKKALARKRNIKFTGVWAGLNI